MLYLVLQFFVHKPFQKDILQIVRKLQEKPLTHRQNPVLLKNNSLMGRTTILPQHHFTQKNVTIAVLLLTNIIIYRGLQIRLTEPVHPSLT